MPRESRLAGRAKPPRGRKIADVQDQEADRAAERWTHRQVSASGVSFHVVVAGDDPQRHTLVLLHPFPMNWWAWRDQIDPLVQAGYRVIVPDLRGFGGSDLRPGEVGLDDLAQDVIAVIRATGTGQFTVVGEGIGGTIAWALAHMNPANLRSVVTVCAPHPLARMPRAAPRSIAAGRVDRALGVPILGQRRVSSGVLVRQVLTSWCAPSSVPHMDEVAPKYARALARPVAASAALETVGAARHPSSRAKRMFDRSVSVPVWSIAGQRDARIPPAAYATDSRHSGAPVTHLEIAGSGHFPSEETPDQLTQILLDHLGEVM